MGRPTSRSPRWRTRATASTPGALFFCVPGFRSDGHDFAPDAVRRGAVALVCQRPLDLGVPEVIVEDVRAAMASAAARFYGDPTADFEVVGITGTNGKTTTAFLVRLMEADGAVRVSGRSSGWSAAARRRSRRPPRRRRSTCRRPSARCSTPATAPARWRCRRTLPRPRPGGSGIQFACRIFTNLTQDHLDFHETMEAYFAAERRLFDGGGPAVVNVDDYGRRLAAEVDSRTFAIDRDADYRALDVEFI